MSPVDWILPWEGRDLSSRLKRLVRFCFPVNPKWLKGSSLALFWREGSTTVEVFLDEAPSFGSFAKMAAPGPHGGSDGGAPLPRGPACFTATFSPWPRRAALCTSQPRRGRLAGTPRSASAKMVAARRHRTLPRWRRAASGTRFPQSGLSKGSGSGGRPWSPRASGASGGGSRARPGGDEVESARQPRLNCHKCRVLSPVCVWGGGGDKSYFPAPSGCTATPLLPVPQTPACRKAGSPRRPSLPCPTRLAPKGPLLRAPTALSPSPQAPLLSSGVIGHVFSLGDPGGGADQEQLGGSSTLPF